MVYVFLLICLIFVVGLILKSRKFKGWFGEFLVNSTNKLALDENIYHTLKNITLKTKDGTTQIDHIIVSQFGIFVVETKNIKGKIFGREKEPRWAVKLFRQTNTIPNPLWQNYGHIKTLEELLNVPYNKFWSLIAFTGESTFGKPMPENVTAGTPAYLAFIKSKEEIILSEKEVKFIIGKIEAYRLTPSMATSKQHIEYVKELKSRSVSIEK